MNHTRTIRLPGVTVWSECASSSSSSARDRYYAQVPQPTTLPTVAFSPSDADPKSGISAIAFSNPEGTLVATKCDSMPSTVWIWSLKLLRPYAVLVHLNPVKSIDWHPTIPELLMVQCAPEDKSSSPAEAASGMMVYLWSTTWKQPRAIHMPLGPTASTTPTTSWAKWVRTPPPSRSTSSSVASTSPQPYTGRITRSHSPQEEFDKRPMILYGDRETCAVGHIEDEPIPDVEEDMGDADADGVVIKDTNGDTAAAATTSFSSPENRNWSSVDWEYYLPNGLPKRTLSSTSRSSNLSLPSVRVHHDGLKPRGGLEKVSSESNKECEDTFGVHKPGVSVVM